jgi:hypothetical protein
MEFSKLPINTSALGSQLSRIASTGAKNNELRYSGHCTTAQTAIMHDVAICALAKVIITISALWCEK